jgi:hypothetical protein
MVRAFSPLSAGDALPGALPAGWYEVAPLALGTPREGTRPTGNSVADFEGGLGITNKVFFGPQKNTIYLQFLKRA